MNLQKEKIRKRIRRHLHLRRRLSGTKQRPRLSVYRSLRNIYCQIIDDTEGKTLVAISTLAPDFRKDVPDGGNVKAATLLGERLARVALEKGIKRIAFDRSGYKYHGRVKALAEAARKAGLEF